MILFQRDKKTEDGDKVYLWYNSDTNEWRISDADCFQLRNNECFMFIKSTGKE